MIPSDTSIAPPLIEVIKDLLETIEDLNRALNELTADNSRLKVNNERLVQTVKTYTDVKDSMDPNVASVFGLS